MTYVKYKPIDLDKTSSQVLYIFDVITIKMQNDF